MWKTVNRNSPLIDELGDKDVVVAGRRIDAVVVNRGGGRRVVAGIRQTTR